MSRHEDDDSSTYAHPRFLVGTDWLAAHLDDPAVRVLDVTAMLTRDLVNRAAIEHYQQGHIPGSMYFDVGSAHGELSEPGAVLPWTWPSAEHFARTMGRYGIDRNTRVVLAARTPRPGIDSGTMWCTRAWWTMHHMGVDVSILLGGIEAWEEEGRPLVTDVPHPEARSFQVADGWEAGRADRDDVIAAIGDGSACVVDALPASSYDGSDRGYGPRKGHITGAVNVPFRELIEGETARFVAADRMRAHLDAAGILDRPRVITYCGGAIAATVDAFALALLGHDDVAVYDGSLMEWSADATLPMVDPSASLE